MYIPGCCLSVGYHMGFLRDNQYKVRSQETHPPSEPDEGVIRSNEGSFSLLPEYHMSHLTHT
jgi:hypothetical protein